MERSLFYSASLALLLSGLPTSVVHAEECSQKEIDDWWQARGNPLPSNVVLPKEYACGTASTGITSRFAEPDLASDSRPYANRGFDDISNAVSNSNAYWTPGQVINVCFMPDRAYDYLRSTVATYAKDWEKYANITFNFKLNGDCEAYGSDIRISLKQSGRSWSYIGTESRYQGNRGEITLQLGWLADRSIPDSSHRSTVIHEFGHALGLHHEQQNPTVQIPFDHYRTYSYFARTNGWCPDKTLHNVLSPLTEDVDFTLWDRYSIMHYEISSSITTNGFSVKRNKELSDGDKLWATMVYPPQGRTRKELWTAYNNYVASNNKLPTREEILRRSGLAASDFNLYLSGYRHVSPAISVENDKLALVDWVRFEVTTRWGHTWEETVKEPVIDVYPHFATENVDPIIDIVHVKAVVHAKDGQELVISKDFKYESGGSDPSVACSNHPAASNYCGAR